MELINTFDTLLSKDDKIRQQANSFLIDQISNNPTFDIDLIELYSTSNVPKYKNISLISIKTLVTMNFEGIQHNFQEFCERLRVLILNSFNYFEIKMLADIVYNIALKLLKDYQQDKVSEFLVEYLTLYQIQNNLIPFCINLYSLIMQNKNFYLRCRTFLEEITSEIILVGLQWDNIEIKLDSIAIFSKISKHVGDDFIDAHQEHIGIIYQLADNSLEINENNESNFYKLWSLLSKIDIKISYPLFETAHTILPSENLSPENRNILFQFIIKKNELIRAEYLEDLITGYFAAQCEIEEVDNTDFVFSSLIKVDEEESYELFKREILAYLTDDDLKRQYVSLCLLPGFFVTYQTKTVNDISETLPIAIDAAMKSEEHLRKGLVFLEAFSNSNKINLNDSILIIDFITEVVSKCTDSNIQYRTLDVCKNLTVNLDFFEKMIGIYQNIQPESYAVFFSILIYFYRHESPISMDKYQPFLVSLVEIFNESIQKVSILSASYQEDSTNSEIKDELYRYTLIQGSAGNLIFFLWFYSPIQLGEFVSQAIESFFYILKDDCSLSDIDDYHYFSLSNITNDFANIVLTIKEPAFELIQDYFDDIVNGQGIESLQHILCSSSDTYISLALNFIEEFNDQMEDIADDPTDKQMILYTLSSTVFPMSKWIYKISDNKELHKNFLKFIGNLIQPDITFDVYNSVSEILLRIVKPKRIEYNDQNQFYGKIIEVTRFLATKMVEIIPKIDKIGLNRYFDGFSNLVLLFAYLKSDNGHELLNAFLVPFFNENQETTETKMLDLFSKLINLEYCNDGEIDTMVEIVKGMIERGKIYHDIEKSLFNLMTNLIKIHSEISPLFIDFAVEIFNENKDDENQIDLNACCARFLLSAFNQNHEESQEKIMPLISEILAVFPFSERNKTVLFWSEIKSFIQDYQFLMTKEIRESLIGCLTRYLSYQKFANIIFSVPDEQHGEIIQLYGELIETYISEHPDVKFKDILDNLIPHQPTSIDYILSLYSENSN